MRVTHFNFDLDASRTPGFSRKIRAQIVRIPNKIGKRLACASDDEIAKAVDGLNEIVGD